MNFFKRLASLFGGRPSTANNRYLTIYLLSRRCREPIEGQIDLLNELSLADESEYSHYAHKTFSTSGRKRCFDQVEVEIWFNQSKQVAHYEVKGGKWLEADVYAQEVVRFNTPLDEDTKAGE